MHKMASKLRWKDVKGRNVGEGSKQRTYGGYAKVNGLSPTAIIYRIFLTESIDAREGRSTAFPDVATTFLYADNDEYLLMLLSCKLAELMVKIDLSLYTKYVTTSKNGVPMLYMQLDKNLCGMLRAVLLFF